MNIGISKVINMQIKCIIRTVTVVLAPKSTFGGSCSSHSYFSTLTPLFQQPWNIHPSYLAPCVFSGAKIQQGWLSAPKPPGRGEWVLGGLEAFVGKDRDKTEGMRGPAQAVVTGGAFSGRGVVGVAGTFKKRRPAKEFLLFYPPWGYYWKSSSGLPLGDCSAVFTHRPLLDKVLLYVPSEKYVCLFCQCTTLKELSVFWYRYLYYFWHLSVSAAAGWKLTMLCFSLLSDAPLPHIPSYCDNHFMLSRRMTSLSAFLSNNSFSGECGSHSMKQ